MALEEIFMRQPAVPPHVMGVLAMASGVLLVGLEIVTAVQSAESTPHATFTPVVWYRYVTSILFH